MFVPHGCEPTPEWPQAHPGAIKIPAVMVPRDPQPGESGTQSQFRQFKNVSDVNAGLFAQQAGLTLDQALWIAGGFASVFSSNKTPDRPSGLDPLTEKYIRIDFEIGQSGVFGPPAGQ
jgi:hypothetical protein